MATRKTSVKEEVKLDEEVKLTDIPVKKTVSGGPFAPRRDGDPFVPCNRKEQFLFSIATGGDCPEPCTREEAFLACIAFGTPDDCPDPCTREELLLYGIAYRMGELLA